MDLVLLLEPNQWWLTPSYQSMAGAVALGQSYVDVSAGQSTVLNDSFTVLDDVFGGDYFLAASIVSSIDNVSTNNETWLSTSFSLQSKAVAETASVASSEPSASSVASATPAVNASSSGGGGGGGGGGCLAQISHRTRALKKGASGLVCPHEHDPGPRDFLAPLRCCGSTIRPPTNGPRVGDGSQ